MTTFHFVSTIISLITVTHIQLLLIHHNQQHYQLMPSINVYDSTYSKTSNYLSHNTISPIESYTTTSNELHKTRYIFDHQYKNDELFGGFEESNCSVGLKNRIDLYLRDMSNKICKMIN
eukprot:263051_1